MEKLHSPVEEVNEEARERDDSLGSQKSAGEEVFREIAEVPENEELNLSAFQEKLFSHVNPEARPDFFKKTYGKKISLGVTGLSIPAEGDRPSRHYRYDKEYQGLAHQAVLETMAEESQSWDDFLGRAKDEDKKWQDGFMPFLIRRFDKERLATARFKTQSELKEHHRISESDKQWEISRLAVEQGLLSEEEAKNYYDAKAKTSYEKATADTCSRFREQISRINKEIPGMRAEIRKYVGEGFKNIYRAIAFEEVRERQSHPDEEDEDVIKMITRVANHSKNLNNLFANRSPEKVIEAARAEIRKRIPGKTTAEDFEDIFDQYEADCRAYFGSLLPGRVVAEKRWTNQHDAIIKRDLDKYLEEKAEPERRTRSIVYDIKQKLAHYARGDEEPVAEVFILATGIVTKMPDGKLGAFALALDDPKLLESFTEDEAEAWKYAWSRYDIAELEKSSVRFRKKINADFVDMVENEPETLSEKEIEAYRLLNQYGIAVPKPIDAERGTFNNSPVFCLEELKEILPIVGKFVKSISTEQVFGQPRTLVDMRESIIGFFGGDMAEASKYLVSMGPTLNMTNLVELMNRNPGNTDKVINYAVLELGRTIYANLDKPSLKEFVALAGDKLDVPEAAFTNAVHRRVPNRNNRRALMCRVVFVSAFRKYLQGEGEPKYKEYFDRLQSKYKTQQLPDQRKVYWEE